MFGPLIVAGQYALLQAQQAQIEASRRVLEAPSGLGSYFMGHQHPQNTPVACEPCRYCGRKVQKSQATSCESCGAPIQVKMAYRPVDLFLGEPVDPSIAHILRPINTEML